MLEGMLGRSRGGGEERRDSGVCCPLACVGYAGEREGMNLTLLFRGAGLPVMRSLAARNAAVSAIAR